MNKYLWYALLATIGFAIGHWLGAASIFVLIGLATWLIVGVVAYSFVDRGDVLFHWVLDAGSELTTFFRLMAWPVVVPLFHFTKDWKPKQ